MSLGFVGAPPVHRPTSLSHGYGSLLAVDVSRKQPLPSDEEVDRGPVRMRHEPCACGGIISSLDLEGFISEAVAAHIRTPGHRSWAAREGYYDPMGGQE